MINAPITPGTHPRQVRRKTISTDPHPRSITASGGKIMANRTCKQDIVVGVYRVIAYSGSEKFLVLARFACKGTTIF